MTAIHLWDDKMTDDIGKKYKCMGWWDRYDLKCKGCVFDAECWRLKKACVIHVPRNNNKTHP